jgi:hypothetical protein
LRPSFPLIIVFTAAGLVACSSSTSAPSDGGGHDAHDGAAGETSGDGAPGDASDAPTADGADGGDAGLACAPACTTDQACINGVCMPAPVVLARAPGCGAARLALAGGRVYWTENATGAVRSLAASGPGTPALVASNQMTPGPITADDVAVYWSNAGDGTIMKAPLASGAGVDGGATDAGATDAGAADGGVAPPLLTLSVPAKGLLASGGFLYYSSGTSTLRVARGGGSPATLASFATCRTSYPFALALDPDYVYQTDMLSQFVTRLRNDGTQLVTNPCVDAGAAQIAAPETLSHSQGELYLDAIYFAGGEVIWVDRATVNAKVPGATSSRDVSGSAGSNPITGFVVSGPSVYFAEGGQSGTTTPAPTDNTIQIARLGNPDAGDDTTLGQVIALGQPGASSFAADDTHVYWSTHAPSATAGAPDDCQIVSLAK